jgi:hypothetical protein
MKVWIGAVALAGLLASGGAAAETGNQMLPACTELLKDSTDNKFAEGGSKFAAGQCLGFISGVTGLLVYAHNKDPAGYPVCLPESGFTNGQALRVYVKYLNANPEHLHYDATGLLMIALGQAYPCKK